MLSTFTDVTATMFEGYTGNPYWGDYNNDGWTDAVVDGNLYGNDEGTFRGVWNLSGARLWGDFDNHGWMDLFSEGSGGGKPVIYRNREGSGGFDAISGIGFSHTATQGSSLRDFNNDGYLDAYIAGYESWPATSFPDRLVVNVEDRGVPGGRTFALAWKQPSPAHARGVTSTDFDEDGDLDIYVSN